MVVVYPDGTWYNKVTPKDVPEIIEKHIISGQPVDRLLLPEEAWS
jgi:(2Fe-2S) ferredoxin